MPREATDLVPPFGATREGVLALVPEVRLRAADTEPAPGQYGITAAHVDSWIDDLTDSVAMALDGWERLSNVAVYGDDNVTVVVLGDRDRLRGSARTLIHNGVASYVEAARHPERAAVNDTSYAEVLWRRYTDGLDRLVLWFRGRLANPEDGDELGGVAHGGPAFGFPAPLFGDSLRF